MKRYFVGVYCPPYPASENSVDRQTKEVFQILKDVGIEQIFGHLEDKFGDLSLVEKSLSICDELGLNFYPRTMIIDRYFLKLEYATYGNYKGKSFLSRSKEEQEKILSDFISQYKEFAKHPSFKGCMFGDEAPMPTFKTIGIARKAFKKEFPDKDFIFNLINYMLTDEYMFGSNEPEYVQKGDMECKSENRFTRYNYFLKNYFDDTGMTDYLSMDAYPYLTYWEDLPTTIHRSLFETSALFAKYKKEMPGLRIMNYIQLGAWDSSVREVNKAEIALNINIQVAYNGDGYIFFPGVTPNDFINTPSIERKYLQGMMGFVDDVGNKTKYVDMVKPLIEQTQAIAPITLDSEFLGVTSVGEFASGFDPNINLDLQKDNDCFYRGILPEDMRYEGEIPNIDVTNQVLISVFKQKSGDFAYLFVNTSIVNETIIKVKLNGEHRLIKDAKEKIIVGEIETKILAGECVLIY